MAKNSIPLFVYTVMKRLRKEVTCQFSVCCKPACVHRAPKWQNGERGDTESEKLKGKSPQYKGTAGRGRLLF
jgi:hypothetical protein